MNIAILTWELNIKGGTQRQALELALSLQNQGHTVDVYCYTYDKEKSYQDLCEKLSIFSVTNASKNSGTPRKQVPQNITRRLWYRFKIYAVLVRNIFTVGKPINQLAELVASKHPLSYYDAINVHDYEVYKAARILNHQNIIWMMNDLQRAKSDSEPSFSFLGTLNKILIGLELKNIKKIVVLDDRNKALCKKHYGRHAIVVRSGIDLNMFAGISTKRTFIKKDYSIFASSIFFPHRRFEDLVDAIEILVKNRRTNIKLTINGLNNRSYDYYLFIRDRIVKKNLSSHITIINGLPEAELVKTYTASDIFVFPNNNQTWGLAVFEAMLAGCACIVSRGSGAHEVLTDKENALLVSPKAPAEIAKAITFLIENPAKMEHISKNSVQFVKNNLSWDAYARHMLQVFSENL